MSEADMENFDDIPDENTMDMMNRAYARARVRSGAAENTAANVLPAHCKESARECVRRFTRVNACVRAFFERSARGAVCCANFCPCRKTCWRARAILPAAVKKRGIFRSQTPPCAAER